MSRDIATTHKKTGPLDELRVLEVGNIVAGPFAGSILADLGADVVKIEHPETGDFVRSTGDVGKAIFYALNRNKRSVALDLKQADDLDALYELVEVSDVFIQNLGPGTASRLDIDYPSLKRRNINLIYLSIDGFRAGPYAEYPGMDVVAEAMSGLMSVTGEAGGQPFRVGTSIADMGSALYGLLGVMIALRERKRTGQGQRVDGTLFEATAHWMGYWLTYADWFDENPDPLGASHPNWGLYDVFEMEGGWLFIGVTNDRHWDTFCEAVEMDEIRTDERFKTHSNRLKNKSELLATVQEQIKDMSRETLFKRLASNGVPAAPVKQPSDLTDDPGLEAAGLLARFETADEDAADQLQSILAPVSGDRFETHQYRNPPNIGEHNTEVLTEWPEASKDGATDR